MGVLRKFAYRVLEARGIVAGTMARKKIILSGLDTKGLGLEIGPSHAPIAPKSEGYHVEILDYADREHLIEKYRALGVDQSRIEEVDHVWNGQRYSDLVGGSDRYDWAIASHVLEHVPDLLGTLLQCQEILKPGGILSIALPDHRYCFDHERSPSTLASVIDAHLRGDTRPTHGSIAEHNLRFALKGRSSSWYPWYPGRVVRSNPIDIVKERFHKSQVSDEYQDVHVWVFTHRTFAVIIQDLSELGLLDFELVSPPKSKITEFFIQLRKRSK